MDPVFVLGERAAALELIGALDQMPALSAMPANRLLANLIETYDRNAADLRPLTELMRQGGVPPARWYREVQAAQLRASGKTRTVEFSGVSILRLAALFPEAQFVVVHQLRRAIPRSRRSPAPAPVRILEIDAADPIAPATLERVLAFLGEEPERRVLDLSDTSVVV